MRTVFAFILVASLSSVGFAAAQESSATLREGQVTVHDSLNGFRSRWYSTEQLSKAFEEGRLAEYKRAADRFPTLESCLEPGLEILSAQGIAVDWGRVDSDTEMEVCFFRIAQELVEPAQMAGLLADLGFADVSSRVGSWTPTAPRTDGQAVRVSAHWYGAAETNSEPLPHIHPLNIIARFFQQDLSILVGYGADGEVLYVSVSIKIY